MSLKLEFLNKLKESYWQRRLYTTIEELPIKTWYKLNETMNLKLLYKKRYFKPNYEVLNRYFAQLFNEYNDKIGFSKDYINYLSAIKRKAQKQLDCITNPTPLNFAQLSLLEAEMESKVTNEQLKLEDIIAKVSKKMGYYIDPNKVSVLQYNSYLKEVANG